MRLIRKSCPDPLGKEKDHHHWSFHSRRKAIFWTLWWDCDHKLGCPIEIAIHTPEKFYLVRPFSNSQTYDWQVGRFTHEFRRITISPEKPEIWERVSRV